MYRIFISYSHQDQGLVSKIAGILEDNGLIPRWDRNFSVGHGFHEQIRNFIAHAHVFLPISTKTADERKWVHQEIGYATAFNIPVLPVAAGRLPGEMIEHIHALPLSDEAGAGAPNDTDLDQLKKHLSKEVIAGLVQRFSDTGLALYQCAEFAEDRATMMAKYCDEVLAHGVCDIVRQKGALSSLHIPAQTINHPIWKARYGGLDRGPVHRRLQRQERIALEAHAREAGCKLIINPYIEYLRYGEAARIVRLECLLEFLESMPDSKCQVAINSEMDHDQSVTILGDWFAAESASAQIGQGYRQTVFTRHAPSMLRKIEAFDQEFEEHLSARGWNAENSRANTIGEIKTILKGLKENREQVVKAPDRGSSDTVEISQPPEGKKYGQKDFLPVVLAHLEVGDMSRMELTQLVMKEFPGMKKSYIETILTDCKNPKYVSLYPLFNNRIVTTLPNGKMIFAQQVDKA